MSKREYNERLIPTAPEDWTQKELTRYNQMDRLKATHDDPKREITNSVYGLKEIPRTNPQGRVELMVSILKEKGGEKGQIELKRVVKYFFPDRGAASTLRELETIVENQKLLQIN